MCSFQWLCKSMILASAVLVSGLELGCARHESSHYGYTSGAKGNSQDKAQESPVQVMKNSIWSGDLKKIGNLIETGFDLESLLETGRTCLSESVVAGELAVVEYLLDRGAKKETKDRFGKQAWDYASDRPLIRRLLKPSEKDRSPELFASIVEMDHQKLKDLLSEGLDPNVFNDRGETLLTESLIRKCENCVRVLLQSKIQTDVNLKNKRQVSPLRMARELRLSRVEKMLLSKGAKED